MVSAMTALSIQFSSTARILGEAARRQNLIVPSFRSPPRVPGRMRTLRRHNDGSVTVSLVVRNRPWSAVVADMIQSFVVANNLDEAAAELARDHLWLAVSEQDEFSLTPDSDAADKPSLRSVA